MEAKYRFSIDRGGTFTDVFGETPDGRVVVLKLLSEDPLNYPDAPREAIRRILTSELGPESVEEDGLIDSKYIEWIRMGTTVATNALLERKGERCALVINQGFKDLLYIGNQSRPDLFDLSVSMPQVIYDKVVEVKERVCLVRNDCHMNLQCTVVTGSTGEKVHVWEDIDKDQLVKDLQYLLEEGINSLAVVLLHSYTYQEHEKQIGSLAKEMGFTHVSLSSDVMPMVKIVPRGYTACADAYLTPCIKRYVNGFCSGFKDPNDLKILFMQSDGGLTSMDSFIGSRAILSGPAGGVVGYGQTTSLFGKPVIGFDMGGTSTDVSRYDNNYEHVFETTVAGITIQAPQLDINTVAAGGGSRLFFRSGLFVVGPESAGANPGPACYGKGGPLTITDANLVLGRLIPEYFPSIFGPNEDQCLMLDRSLSLMAELTETINLFLLETDPHRKPLSTQEVAMGFIAVANESMSRPIRALTQGKGYNTSEHVLACFGGAGGQHACSIANSLGMKNVFIHKYAGILSAYGLALADVVHECIESCALVYDESNFNYIDQRIDVLVKEGVAHLISQGFPPESIQTTPFLHLRYDKTDCALMCTPAINQGGVACRHGDFLTTFTERYKTEFGFIIPSRPVVVDDIRVRAVAKGLSHSPKLLPLATEDPNPVTFKDCYFATKGYVNTPVYLLHNLTNGHKIKGPAIIIDKLSTILVETNCLAGITEFGDINMSIGRQEQSSIGSELDMIQLSIFSHRFMSIAEQMGRVLQRTSISTNIKERLDFSCALFGPDGGLVANAPHIPVHLGAMQETVQYQLCHHKQDLRQGTVLLSNHPTAGGSHLPDLNVVTPVFYPGEESPVFFVANRGHHADIGGISPGSMPPNSTHINEEGMAVKSFKLVENGIFQEEGVTELLMSPAQFPGCSGTRNLHDNLSDLRAQVAANQKGISLVKELIDCYGLKVVQSYMKHIQENAEIAVRDKLKEIAKKAQCSTGSTSLSAVEFMDDGSPVRVTININKDEGTAYFDFTGTGPQVPGNTNAPRAVTFAAILYSLRCIVGHDIPLNQGCLKPITVHIPDGTILSPDDTAAVIGGNVLTSQRLCDVILKAFSACAGSQGCMNNTTFGDDTFGYYETVAGGAGAGPGWNGRSGVHTHMTNTRITDPEILERRYPVILKQFSLNPGTGGKGQYFGGDGVIRETMFRKPLTVCVLSERRVYHPYGLHGGEDGSKGKNTLIKSDGGHIDLGGKKEIDVKQWDVLRLETPGGGGYGCHGDESPPTKKPRVVDKVFHPLGSVSEYKQIQESA
ncbi:PREDICTED: 5-oxoprolinase [Amphimedon queenslandica]|uniref:5-oxoprolinase n=1 Tax=Amphimedon queenslandica TaxID=400682 RepID=A0A1X7UM21_AMPQE|nr:PREDICTED: 5-oxoprolinase [Amphimedon queenslandica]|eukprot:XP_003387513.1 PREDICTED: 5-oxoprolinase [Amphimedon queenslandica]